MADLLLERALLPTGWTSSVRMSVAPDGTIASLSTLTDRGGAQPVTGVVVPGVPNLHSHAFQRGLAGTTERGSPDGDSFWSWRARMYAFLERLGPEDVEAIAAQLFSELLRHGFTAVAEFHYLRNAPDGRPYEDPVETARRVVAGARTAGMGLTMLPVVYTSADFGGRPLEGGQRRFRADAATIAGDVDELTASLGADGDVSVGLALHSLRAVPPAALGDALAAREARGAGRGPVHLHVAEQTREVDACLAWSGARPVAWLLDHAEVNGAWTLVHATHVEPSEVERLAASGAAVALCPTTEANLGDGLFPLPAYAAAGGRWGVGTDSHVDTSPAAELRLLEYGQRLSRRERNVAAGRADASSGRALLDAAWAVGPGSTGRRLGRLETGARADLVVLDPDHPALVGLEDDDLLDAWIFSGSDTPVRDVMVSGRWVVEDGRHVGQEPIEAAFRDRMRTLR